MKKPRIAMIVNSNIYSGLEKVVSEIMIDLADDYEFIYVTKNGPVVERFKELGLECYLLEEISVKSIKRFIVDWRPDIIHAHDFRASTMVALCGFNDFISHLHNNPLWIKKLNINSLAYLLFGLKSKKVLIVSNSVKEEFIFNRLIDSKYECIGNPLDIESVITKERKDSFKKYDLCCVGRIEEQKDPLKFLKVVKSLVSTNPNLKACWVGDGSLMNQCKKYVSENNLEKNVFFTGYMNNPYEVMNQSRIFMLTSSFEGFGLVAFEALCLGLPCVVSNVGGLKDIVNSSCGFLCNSQLDFEKAVNSLLKERKTYETMSTSAKERAKELNNRNDYMRHISYIYDNMLDGKK